MKIMQGILLLIMFGLVYKITNNDVIATLGDDLSGTSIIHGKSRNLRIGGVKTYLYPVPVPHRRSLANHKGDISLDDGGYYADQSKYGRSGAAEGGDNNKAKNYLNYMSYSNDESPPTDGHSYGIGSESHGINGNDNNLGGKSQDSSGGSYHGGRGLGNDTASPDKNDYYSSYRGNSHGNPAGSGRGQLIVDDAPVDNYYYKRFGRPAEDNVSDFQDRGGFVSHDDNGYHSSFGSHSHHSGVGGSHGGRDHSNSIASPGGNDYYSSYGKNSHDSDDGGHYSGGGHSIGDGSYIYYYHYYEGRSPDNGGDGRRSGSIISSDDNGGYYSFQRHSQYNSGGVHHADRDYGSVVAPSGDDTINPSSEGIFQHISGDMGHGSRDEDIGASYADDDYYGNGHSNLRGDGFRDSIDVRSKGRDNGYHYRGVDSRDGTGVGRHSENSRHQYYYGKSGHVSGDGYYHYHGSDFSLKHGGEG